MLSKAGEVIFNGRRAFDEFRFDLETALSVTSLTGRSRDERLAAVNMWLLAQSESMTLACDSHMDMASAEPAASEKHVFTMRRTRQA